MSVSQGRICSDNFTRFKGRELCDKVSETASFGRFKGNEPCDIVSEMASCGRFKGNGPSDIHDS